MQRAAHIALLIALAGSPLAAQDLPDAPARPVQPAAEPPQQSPDAIAALQATAEAVKDGFAADVSSYAEGSLASSFSRCEGLWTQNVLGDAAEWKVRFTGSGTVALKNDSIDFDALWQPDRVTWVDHNTRTLNVSPIKGSRGGEAFQLFNGAFGQLEPLSHGFADELKAASLEMREPAEVDGVMCSVVAITAKTGSDPVLWYMGREDHLPRRCEIVLPGQELIKALRVDLAHVTAGPEALADAVWEVEAPADYERKIARQFQERAQQPAPTANRPPKNTGAGGPDWEIADSDGTLVSPGALRGKVSVLYFWGTWSPACKKAVPVVAAYAEDYKDKPVEIVSMAFREGTPDAVVRAAREEGQTWRQVTAADDIVKMLGIRVAPSFIVLGPQGELLMRSGRPKGDDFEALFSQIREITDRALADAPAADAEKDTSGGPAAKGPGDKVAPAGASPAKPGSLPTKRKGG